MNISRYTLYKLLKKIANIIIPKYYFSFIPIGGSDVIIEAEESKFGRRKYNKVYKIEGVWAFECVERTTERRIFLVEVAKTNTETLQEVMKIYIHKNSIICTDCWKAYNDKDNYFFVHYTANHSKGFVDEHTKIHTNAIEGNWSAIKSQICIRRRRPKNYISLHLVRFMLIRNEKENAFKTTIKLLF